MKEEDIVLCDVAILLSASKSTEYKKSAIKRMTSLLTFLNENNLLIDLEPFDEDGSLKLDVIVRKKNLTDDGYKIFKNGFFEKWLGYLSRSTSPNKEKNISHLEKGLQKIREKTVRSP